MIEVDRKREIRCPMCGKLLSLGRMAPGTKLEIKCPRCKEFARFEAL